MSSLVDRLSERNEQREQQQQAEAMSHYNLLLRVPLNEMSEAQIDEMAEVIGLLKITPAQAEADRKAIERERTYTIEANRLTPETLAASKAIKGLREEEAQARAELTRIQGLIDRHEVPIKAREKVLRMAEEVRRLNGKLFS